MKTYKKADYESIIKESKEKKLVPLIYHEVSPNKRYHAATKNMLTRRLKASGIAWIELHKNVIGKNDKTKVKTFTIIEE